jgi:hypothetical protein
MSSENVVSKNEQQLNPHANQVLAAFFGGGGKYIGEPV